MKRWVLSLPRVSSCTEPQELVSVVTGEMIVTNIVHVGKTLLAKAVANQTSATFLRVCGSELIQKYLVINWEYYDFIGCIYFCDFIGWIRGKVPSLSENCSVLLKTTPPQ